MTRVSLLEQKYPSVPPLALLKADLLFTGLRVNQALLDAGQGALPHFRSIQVQGRMRPLPYFLQLDTPHQMLILVRPDDASPYHLEAQAKAWVLMEDDHVIRAVRPQPQPAWRTWAEKQGLSRMALGMSQHGDMLVPNLAPACEYWPLPGEADEHRCRFCGYGAVSERSRGLGQRRDVASVGQDVLDEFALTAARARPEVRHLYLVGGSMRDRALEAERYREIAWAAVQAEPSYRGLIGCGSQALPRESLPGLHKAGVGYLCFNLEVWDPDIWRAACPGKARFIGRDQWLQDMLSGVEIFGRGAVLSAFVAGTELVGPRALPTVQRALESSLQGADWLLQRGIVPLFSPFTPTLGSEYQNASAPTLDYFLRLNVETAALRRSHGLAVNTSFVCSRCTYGQLECDLDGPDDRPPAFEADRGL